MLNKRAFGYLSWRFRRARIHRIEVLAALTRDLARAAPDHIAVTGDIVNISLPTEFTRTADWLRTLGSSSTVSIVPGNHDAYVAVSWNRSWAAWQEFMTSDPAGADEGGSPEGDGFPFIRRRGPVALIGLSTAVPTAPGQASGVIGRRQLERLASYLGMAGDADLFRVVLLHHPPIGGNAPRRKRLADAEAFHRVIADVGAELILHGHEHRFRFGELAGARGPVPVFGVPSASMLPGRPGEVAGQYHLHRIERCGERWLVDTRMRAYRADLGDFVETGRTQLVLPSTNRAPAPSPCTVATLPG
jgi:3',5'-cyclic AMP phosphodiesterase CpdA